MIIAGIDEAGRGCWAGPLVACAVILPDNSIAGLNDSKQITAKKREALYHDILLLADVGIGIVAAADVDRLGLTKATAQAMFAAVKGLTSHYEHIIIDGNYNYLQSHSIEPSIETRIKADATVAQVSAASIVAKVTRDKFMQNKAAKLFPQYEFDKHVGYGTARHKALLLKHGPCELHRKSYKPIQALLS